MADADDSQDVEDRLREVREALDAREVDEALDGLLESRELGFFHADLDDQIAALRDDPDAEAIRSVREWVAVVLDPARSPDGESPERQRELESEPTEESEADQRSGAFAAGESEIEGASEPLAEDSTARDAAEDSGADFARDSSQATAVGHESLSELDSDELEAMSREMTGASSEFDRLPSVDFAMVDSDAADEELEELEVDDDGRSDRETKENPSLESIDWGKLREVDSDGSERPAVGEDRPGSEAEDRRGGEGAGLGDTVADDGSGVGDAVEQSPVLAAESERDLQREQQSRRSLAEGSSEPVESGDDIPDFDLGLHNPGSEDEAKVESEENGEGASESEESQRPPSRPSPDAASGPVPGGPVASDSEPREAMETPMTDVGAEVDASAGSGASPLEEDSALAEASSAVESVEERDPEASVPPSEEPLSDEEFFGLADELSEITDATDEETEDAGDAGTGAEPAGSEMAETQRSDAAIDARSADEAFGRPTSSFDAAEGEGTGERPESRQLADEARRLVEQAEDLIDQGQFEPAHDLVQSVLDQAPESQHAQSLLIRIERERAESDAEGDDRPTTERPSVSDSLSGGRSEADEEEAAPARTDGNDPELESLEAAPRQLLDLEEIAEGDVDHRMGFLLSLIDGTVSFEDILELSSMSRRETIEVLVDMLEKEIIEVDD